VADLFIEKNIQRTNLNDPKQAMNEDIPRNTKSNFNNIVRLHRGHMPQWKQLGILNKEFIH
jgi:uncharacterized protein YydD (DUF2326 family)